MNQPNIATVTPAKDSNGNGAPIQHNESNKSESALASFLKSLDPKAKPNATDKKAAAQKFRAFQAKRAAALKVLKELDAEEAEVARECLKAFGKAKLTVDGIDFVATSRDERIYYKEMSGKGIEI